MKQSSQLLLMMAAAMAAVETPQRSLYTPPTPHDLSNYPEGRTLALEGDGYSYPVTVKSATDNALTVRAAVLGKVRVGERVYLNPGYFSVHRVSARSVTLRPA